MHFDFDQDTKINSISCHIFDFDRNKVSYWIHHSSPKIWQPWWSHWELLILGSLAGKGELAQIAEVCKATRILQEQSSAFGRSPLHDRAWCLFPFCIFWDKMFNTQNCLRGSGYRMKTLGSEFPTLPWFFILPIFLFYPYFILPVSEVASLGLSLPIMASLAPQSPHLRNPRITTGISLPLSY